MGGQQVGRYLSAGGRDGVDQGDFQASGEEANCTRAAEQVLKWKNNVLEINISSVNILHKRTAKWLTDKRFK